MTTVHETAAAAKGGLAALQILRERLRSLALPPVMSLVDLLRRLDSASRRRHAERELDALSDGTLKDIGIARSEIPWLAAKRSKPWHGGNHDAR